MDGTVPSPRRLPGILSPTTRCFGDDRTMGHHAITVDEANEMLPEVRVTLDELQALRDVARSEMDQLAVLDALWGDLVSQSSNPDHEEYAQHRHSLSECHRAIEELIQQRLVDRGIRFPVGGLEHGLVDFPTTLDGRWVYLLLAVRRARGGVLA